MSAVAAGEKVGSERQAAGVLPAAARPRIAIIGPVYPYRGGIAYCTTRLAEEMAGGADLAIVSFKRQYPQRFYPGGDDTDESLRDRTPQAAEFLLDILNPLSWLAVALRLRRERPQAVIFVWWIWVWALPYLVIMAALPRSTRRVLQCHNVGDKEPAWWKSALTNRVLRRGSSIVVHAGTEAAEVRRRLNIGERAAAGEAVPEGASAPEVFSTFLPVHELGGAIPSREEARKRLGLSGRNIALFFGHIRPFKGLDIALRAWRDLKFDATLIVAGEAWWEGEEQYRRLARHLGLLSHNVFAVPAQPGAAGPQVVFDFRFIPDAEIATYFAAADVVLAPYRIEAQSGVALTAFHFARPVIATAVGGLPEIIDEGQNGMLVAPEDPGALAAALDRFFTSLDREAMSRSAAESAQRYSWPEYAAGIRGLIAARP